jgi:hypothetical protein
MLDIGFHLFCFLEVILFFLLTIHNYKVHPTTTSMYAVEKENKRESQFLAYTCLR